MPTEPTTCIEDEILEYDARVRWTGNRGDGTKSYGAYDRDHELRVGENPPVPGSADPRFRGDPDHYSPEDLLVGSVSGCHMLWYLHLCADAGVVVVDYEDRPIGRMVLERDGGGAFAEVILRPLVGIKEGSDPERARALHSKAHAKCFIARSVAFPVRCEAVIEVRSEYHGNTSS